MTISSKVFKNKVLVAIIVTLFALIELVTPHGFIESHEKLEYEIEVSIPSSRIRFMRKIASKLKCIKKQLAQTYKWLHTLFQNLIDHYETLHYIPILQIQLIMFYQKYHFAMIGSVFHGDQYKSNPYRAC